MERDMSLVIRALNKSMNDPEGAVPRGQGPEEYAHRHLRAVEPNEILEDVNRDANLPEIVLPPLSEEAEKIAAQFDLKSAEAVRDQQNALCDSWVAEALAIQAATKARGDALVELVRKDNEDRARRHAAMRAFHEGTAALAEQHNLMPIVKGAAVE